MYNKIFFERYAKASLEFFYKEKIVNFIQGESPDLQNEVDNIGIEVTRGISQYEGKVSRLESECMSQNLHLEQRFSRANRMFRKNFLGVIHESGGFVITDPENGDNSYEIHIRQILGKIKIKIEKLHKLYKKYDWNCLYIFSEYPLKPKQLWVLADILNGENLIDYDLYFINAVDCTYVINARDGFNYTCHKYSASELCNFTDYANKKDD